jgi:hypothetical protein
VFDLPSTPAAAALVIGCDNRFKVFINGRELASGEDFSQPRLVEAGVALRAGRNVIAVEAANNPGTPNEPDADQSNPAGLIAELTLRLNGTPGGPPIQSLERLGTSRSWRWSLEAPDGWKTPDFNDAHWKPAIELGPPETAPWHAGDNWRTAVATASRVGQARAALMVNDPLLAALGRPNREQVVTSRLTVATTLQALELTNGETLADWLGRGASQLLSQRPASAEALVAELYRRTLSRVPSAEESRLAGMVLGSEPESAGVEDLLWAMIMLPEFQLIH